MVTLEQDPALPGRIRDLQRLREAPGDPDVELGLEVVVEEDLLEGAELDQAPIVPEVEHLGPIRRLRRLLQHQEHLEKAGLPRAVAAKKGCDGREPNRSGLPPRLEALEGKPGQHQKISLCYSTGAPRFRPERDLWPAPHQSIVE